MSSNLSGKKILLTGGAGFIGSYIAETLVEQGAEVVVYDNFSSGKMTNLEKIKGKIEIVNADILDYDSLSKACQCVDIISHQAASLEIFRTLNDPFKDLQVNVTGTLNVLNAAVKNDVKKIVNASSGCVYGQAQRVPQDEDHPKNPNWPYGVSKLAAENYCNIFSKYYDFSVVSLRYAFVYGEREWFGRAHPIFIKRAIEDKPPVLFGDGHQSRDYIHVRDVVEFHNKCLATEGISGAYNVGTGVGTKMESLARLLCRISGKDLQPIWEDVKEGELSKLVPGRRRIPLELKTMVLDPSKGMKDLGWRPTIGLEEGFRNEYAWALKNMARWKVEGEIFL